MDGKNSGNREPSRVCLREAFPTRSFQAFSLLKGENRMSRLWLLWAAILPALALPGCASLSPALQTPQAEVVKLEPEWTSPENSSYVMEIKIRNANPMTLLLSRLDVTLTAGDQIARQSLNTQMPMVPAYTERTISLSLRLPAPLAATAGGPRRFVADGKIQTASQWQTAPISFKQEFNLTSPILPRAAIAKVRTVRTPRKQFLLLTVANPNAFPVALRRIRAEVRSAGRTFPLRPAQSELALEPGKTAELSLALEGGPLTPQNKRAAVVSGEMEFSSPSGRLLIPLPSILP